MNIAPNHLKIAGKFAFSDNFYCDSDASIHGHHWMLGVIPNEWVEANSATTRTAKKFSKASGRRFPGSTGSMDPEDYAERGGLWEALDRSGVSFYNFGEANETAHNREAWFDTLTGSGHSVMVPMQKALFPAPATTMQGSTPISPTSSGSGSSRPSSPGCGTWPTTTSRWSACSPSCRKRLIGRICW